MKNFLIGILIVVLAFCLCGCGGDKAETSASNTSGLEQYVTNSEEVTTILQERFGTNELTYENTTAESDMATLAQFGNGNYDLQVNGVRVIVVCENHIALWVRIFVGPGANSETTFTPSGLTPPTDTTADTNSDSDTVSFMGWNS